MKANAVDTFSMTIKFVCPECGSKEAEPLSLEAGLKKGHGLRYSLTCARCRWKIPAHLAERWGDISIQAAKLEWRHVYRDAATEPAENSPTRDWRNKMLSAKAQITP